jgi:hypothetical protein
VTVVVFNNLVKELSKGSIRVSRSSIGSNVGVWILATREDALLE